MENYISGRHLKTIRVKANITTSVMAEFMGIRSRKTIENWESGQSTPSINQFILFCRFCDVHPYDVVQQAMSDFAAQSKEEATS